MMSSLVFLFLSWAVHFFFLRMHQVTDLDLATAEVFFFVCVSATFVLFFNLVMLSLTCMGTSEQQNSISSICLICYEITKEQVSPGHETACQWHETAIWATVLKNGCTLNSWCSILWNPFKWWCMKYALSSHYRPEAQKWLVTHSQLFALCVQLIDPLALCKTFQSMITAHKLLKSLLQ